VLSGGVPGGGVLADGSKSTAGGIGSVVPGRSAAAAG
jgi:hypothetical protein